MISVVDVHVLASSAVVILKLAALLLALFFFFFARRYDSYIGNVLSAHETSIEDLQELYTYVCRQTNTFGYFREYVCLRGKVIAPDIGPSDITPSRDEDVVAYIIKLIELVYYYYPRYAFYSAMGLGFLGDFVNRRRIHSKVIKREFFQEPFYIEDLATGSRVLVCSEGARMQLMEAQQKYYFPSEDVDCVSLDKPLRAIVKSLNLHKHHFLRCVAHFYGIPVGSTVLVLGEAEDSDGILKITHPQKEDKLFVISFGEDRRTLLHEFQGKKRILEVLCVLFSVFSLSFFIFL